MRILTKYILKESSQAFLLSIILFTFIMLLDRIFDLVDLIINKGIGLLTVGRLLFYALPFTLNLSIPMSVLMGILIALSRFSSDNEITAIKASGINTFKFIWPVLITSLVISLACIYFNDTLVPQANHAFRKLYLEILSTRPVLKLEAHTFTEIKDYQLYIEKIDYKKNLLQDIIIYKKEQGNVPSMITARGGQWLLEDKKGLVLQLENGSRHIADKNNLYRYNKVDFENFTLVIPLEEVGAGQAIKYKGLREMNKRELTGEITKLQQSKINANTFLVELNLRTSIPFAALAFALLAIPLGVKTHHAGRAIGFGLSLVFIFVYYLLLILGITLGQKGVLHPLIAVWLPNLALGSIGLYFFSKVIRGKL